MAAPSSSNPPPIDLHAGEHVYLGLGLTSKRRTKPAMELEDLPPLDLVLLSHHHGDHFDRVAAEGLDKDLPIVTEPHSARKLASQGFRRRSRSRRGSRRSSGAATSC